jgi:hypothetical protein
MIDFMDAGARNWLFKHEKAYREQRNQAATRQIPFLLTRYEWFQIWENSGFLELRGHRKGQYCMARFGDVGPYAVGNVKIISVEENHREAMLGKKFTDQHKQKIGKANKGERNGCAKLTEQNVLYIRKVYIPKHPKFGQCALARELGVSQARVWDVLQGLSWKHVGV